MLLLSVAARQSNLVARVTDAIHIVMDEAEWESGSFLPSAMGSCGAWSEPYTEFVVGLGAGMCSWDVSMLLMVP